VTEFLTLFIKEKNFFVLRSTPQRLTTTPFFNSRKTSRWLVVEAGLMV
jgi:hypothetical protein